MLLKWTILSIFHLTRKTVCSSRIILYKVKYNIQLCSSDKPGWSSTWQSLQPLLTCSDIWGALSVASIKPFLLGVVSERFSVGPEPTRRLLLQLTIEEIVNPDLSCSPLHSKSSELLLDDVQGGSNSFMSQSSDSISLRSPASNWPSLLLKYSRFFYS